MKTFYHRSSLFTFNSFFIAPPRKTKDYSTTNASAYVSMTCQNDDNFCRFQMINCKSSIALWKRLKFAQSKIGVARSLTTMSKPVAGLKYNNVYITPSYIEFADALEGVSYQQCITIKNIGNTSVFIRIRQPNSIVNISRYSP